MKQFICAETLLAILVLCLFSSCATSKKMALPCPASPNNYISKLSVHHKGNSQKTINASQRGKKGNYNFNKQTVHFNKSKNEPVRINDEQKQQQGNLWSTQSENINLFNKTE